MQKNIKLRNINIDFDSSFFKINNFSGIEINNTGNQIIFNDYNNESQSIKINQTAYDDIIFKIDDGIFRIQDEYNNDKVKIGITNSNGLIWSYNDLTIQLDGNSGYGLLSLNSSLNFENENNFILYKDSVVLGFFDSVSNTHQTILDSDGSLQLGQGSQQTITYNNELNANEEIEDLILQQGEEIKFYTNMQSGWQYKNIQKIDINGNFSGSQQSQDKLNTQRIIELSGEVQGSQNFDGSKNITIDQTISQHHHDERYYTKTNLSTQGEQTLDWNNLNNKPDLTLNTQTNIKNNNWVLDEDDFISNDDTKVPTQSSTKKYVDSRIKIIDNVLLQQQNWIDDTNGVLGYWYIDFHSNIINNFSIVDMYFDFQSNKSLENINIFNKPNNGFIRFYQNNKPSQNLECRLKVINK